MFMYWHGVVLALSVSASQVLIAPPAAFGQTTSSDTEAPTDSLAASSGDSLASSGDSLAVPRDSVPTPGDTGSLAPPDTLDSIPRPGSDSVPAAGRADTARSPSDSVPAAAARDSARRPAAAVPAAPVDSILSAACGRPGGSPSIARDLLVVVFAPEAGAAERAAAAENVGGKVLGPAEPGAWYIKLPAGGGEAGLRAAADQLSLVTGVRQVGSRACPPTPS